MDPKNEVIYKRSGEVQGIILFETTVPGKYTFIFSNLNDHNDRTVSLALHTFEDIDDIIQWRITDEGELEIVDNFNGVPTEAEQIEIDLACDKDVYVVRTQLRDAEKAAKQIDFEVKGSVDR
jgi:hypothetical protein